MPQIIEIPGYGEVEFPDDMSDEQISQAIKNNLATERTFPEKIQRQAGLTGRAITSGLVGTADFLASPIRELANLALPDDKNIQPLTPQLMQYFPAPENSTERVVQNIGQAVVGAGTGLGAAQAAAPITQTGQAIKTALSSSPWQQFGGAVGAGGGSGIVAESGGGPIAQIIGGLAGGYAGAGAVGGLQTVGKKASDYISRPPKQQQQIQIDIKINDALKQSGVKLADIEPALRQSLRDDVIKASQVGKPLSQNAIRRLADYKLAGATPTKGRLTSDPATVTREKNLAKQGINSTDPQAQRLGVLENENNQTLLSKIDDLGANKAVDQYQAGQNLKDTLAAFGKTQKDNISNLYNQARDTSGRAAELDNYAFTQTVGKELNKAAATAFLPKEYKTTLNSIAKGETPLTVDVAEQLKSMIARDMRSPSNIGSPKFALGVVYDALENAPLKSNQQLGQASLTAFRQARDANKAFMQQEKSIPALKAAMEGVEPDAFFDKFVIRGDYNSLQKTLKFIDPATKDTIRNNVVSYIKNAATNGQPNETARLSGDAMRKAIARIGDNKLKLLFSQDEIAQLKAIERVAKYEGFLPVGSAVNTSNTASALMSRTAELLANSPLIGKIPLGNALIGEPARNIQIGIGARQAFDIPKSLTIDPLQGVVSKPYIGSAYIGTGGLLQK